MTQARPPSPFLALLLAASSTALLAEWLRFNWGLPVAIAPALIGALASGWITARAFRARRRWRLRRQRSAVVARRLAPAPDAREVDGWSVHARARPYGGHDGAASRWDEDRAIEAIAHEEVTPARDVEDTVPGG